MVKTRSVAEQLEFVKRAVSVTEGRTMAEKTVSRQRQWQIATGYKEDPDSKKARARYKQQLKEDAIGAYGGKCECCGITELVFLTLDHPNGDGAAWRLERFGTKLGSGTRTYLWLKQHDYPPGLRVLCLNCNFATWRGVCPHQKEKDG